MNNDEKQTEYDLGWENCSSLYEKEIKRLREVLQRIANGDPPGDYVRMTLDEAMARFAEAALSSKPEPFPIQPGSRTSALPARG